VSVDEAIWARIRAGQSPTENEVAQLAGRDLAVLGDRGAKEFEERLRADVLGAGPLQVLLEDPAVTDVLVNGTRGVFVDRGRGLQPVPIRLGDAASIRRLAVRLASSAGRRLDDTSPFVDGLLPTGVRLHAILPPLVDGAAHISLRVPRRTAMSLNEIARSGMVGPWGEQLLQRLIRARMAFVISGGTGCGKTTLLAALLGMVPGDERIVIVEDVRELGLMHPHVVRMEARPANVEGQGAIGLPVLVRQSLRMRPDRLVVGEVRGAEVRELLAALNTGHEGGCGTLHANAIVDVVARFEALGALAGMSPAAVRSQLASAVRVVLQLKRVGVARVLAQVGVLQWSGERLEVAPAAIRGSGEDDLRPAPAWSVLDDLLGTS
jgi:pilus assembly protein CpaF